MSTTVSAFITDLDSKYANAYTNANKLSWVNEIEANVYADNVKVYAAQYYRKIKDVYQYTLPSGTVFEDLYKLFVNDSNNSSYVDYDDKIYDDHINTEYKKVDLRTDRKVSSYWYEQSKINLYPTPTESDVQYVSGASQITFKAISYTSGASEFTFAHNTITTIGTAFTASAFVVGNKITISGCLTTSNNIEAVITGVAASVLTFDDNTFDADTTADTGAITLATNCIYTSGVDFDGFAVDDVILVSGCLLTTTNNKYAVITDVQDDVLTFAIGTFGARAEVAAITIQECSIKVIYQSQPTAKLIANIATDTLLIPDRFSKIYTWYCIAQMAVLNREFDDYSAYMTLYNDAVAEYLNWYGQVAPIEPLSNIQIDSNW